MENSESLTSWQFLRVFLLLTRTRTRELPLSCSGTPERTRCPCRRLSFLFSSLVLPLRFCLFRVFFLGASGAARPLGSRAAQAAVGHATLLCSEGRLKVRQRCDTPLLKRSREEKNTEKLTECEMSKVKPAGEAVRGGEKGAFQAGWTKLLRVLGFT